MILTFEICTTKELSDKKKEKAKKEETKKEKTKKVGFFKGWWDGQRCWRIWFWQFSIAYFPSSDMKKFIDTCSRSHWFEKSVR